MRKQFLSTSLHLRFRPGTTQAGRSFYGMRQTIIGGNVVKPVYEPLKISLYGEIMDAYRLRPSSGQPSPSIQFCILKPQRLA